MGNKLIKWNSRKRRMYTCTERIKKESEKKLTFNSSKECVQIVRLAENCFNPPIAAKIRNFESGIKGIWDRERTREYVSG